MSAGRPPSRAGAGERGAPGQARGRRQGRPLARNAPPRRGGRRSLKAQVQPEDGQPTVLSAFSAADSTGTGIFAKISFAP